MNENTTTQSDSFATNSGSIDGTSNVASYEAAAGVNIVGGSLIGAPILGSSSTNVSIRDYLSRPKLLLSGQLDDYISTPLVFKYASLFFSEADIQEKVKYHNLIRGTFQIKLVVTAAPYATGILTLAHSYDTIANYGVFVANTPLLVNHLSQKTHVDCDLGSTNTCTLSIPFHLRTPYLLNSNPDLTELDKLIAYFYTLTPLKNTQVNTTTLLYYKIYVNLVDAEISVPVPIVGTYTSETQSAMDGPISGPASVVAMIGRKLSDVPFIGPFALAAEIGANAVAGIARLFGFSRPRDFSKLGYPHFPNGASGIGEVRAKNLSLDPLQEVTVDPSVFGEKGDNLSFENTAMRYGLVHIEQWLPSTTAGSEIFKFPVTPTLCYIYDQTYDIVSPTPLSYVSNLFQAWRGSLTYKITIPANRFVRGKMRIYWSPSDTASDISLVTNNALSVLLDFSMSTTVELTIPWLSNNLYRSIRPHIPVTYSSTSQDYFNGWLHFMVEEPLLTNNTSWEASIVVYIKAAEDFDLAIPATKFIQPITFSIPPTPATATPVGYDVIQFQPPDPGSSEPILEGAYATYTSETNNVNPSMSTQVQMFPSSDSNTPQILHMGEKIMSLRSVLKRFSPYVTVPAVSVANANVYSLFLPYLPYLFDFFGGSGLEFGTWRNTPLAYLSRMFGGMRGSIRYYSMQTRSNQAELHTYASRGFGANNKVYWAGTNNPSGNYSTLNFQYLWSYLDYGVNYFRGMNEPVIVDLPYQNYHWFYPTVRKSAIDDGCYGLFLSQIAHTPGNFIMSDIHVAAGEDLQFVIYNGPPLYVLYSPDYNPS